MVFTQTIPLEGTDETFDAGIFPGMLWLDGGRLATGVQLGFDLVSDELRSVVTSLTVRHIASRKQALEHIQHPAQRERAGDEGHQTLTSELIQHHQQEHE